MIRCYTIRPPPSALLNRHLHTIVKKRVDSHEQYKSKDGLLLAKDNEINESQNKGIKAKASGEQSKILLNYWRTNDGEKLNISTIKDNPVIPFSKLILDNT